MGLSNKGDFLFGVILFVPTSEASLDTRAPDLCPLLCKTTTMICGSTEITAGQRIMAMRVCSLSRLCSWKGGRDRGQRSMELGGAIGSSPAFSKCDRITVHSRGHTQLFYIFMDTSYYVRFSIHHRHT